MLLLIGGEFWPPLAIVLAGGVGGSTLLAVLFAPAAYRLLQRLSGFRWIRGEKPGKGRRQVGEEIAAVGA